MRGQAEEGSTASTKKFIIVNSVIYVVTHVFNFQEFLLSHTVVGQCLYGQCLNLLGCLRLLSLLDTQVHLLVNANI